VWIIACAAISLAIVAGTGCGDDSGTTAASDEPPTIDPDTIEPQLIADLADFAGVDPSTVDLECPTGVPIEEGHEFECTLTAPDGSTAVAKVTVTSVTRTGDQIDYEVDGRVPKSQFK
jgi:hypothetical protein